MCSRYCVLGFAAHSIISGVDCICWWWLLYGWWPLRFHRLWHRFQGVCKLVLRLVARRLFVLSYVFWEMWGLFLCTILRDQIHSFILLWWYSFEIFWAPACAWLNILMKFMLPIYMFMSYLLIKFWKWYQMFLLSAAIKCLRKLIIELSVIKNE